MKIIEIGFERTFLCRKYGGKRLFDIWMTANQWAKDRYSRGVLPLMRLTGMVVDGDKHIHYRR